jgi:hypothetical protein
MQQIKQKRQPKAKSKVKTFPTFLKVLAVGQLKPEETRSGRCVEPPCRMLETVCKDQDQIEMLGRVFNDLHKNQSDYFLADWFFSINLRGLDDEAYSQRIDELINRSLIHAYQQIFNLGGEIKPEVASYLNKDGNWFDQCMAKYGQEKIYKRLIQSYIVNCIAPLVTSRLVHEGYQTKGMDAQEEDMRYVLLSATFTKKTQEKMQTESFFKAISTQADSEKIIAHHLRWLSYCAKNIDKDKYYTLFVKALLQMVKILQELVQVQLTLNKQEKEVDASEIDAEVENLLLRMVGSCEKVELKTNNFVIILRLLDDLKTHADPKKNSEKKAKPANDLLLALECLKDNLLVPKKNQQDKVKSLLAQKDTREGSKIESLLVGMHRDEESPLFSVWRDSAHRDKKRMGKTLRRFGEKLQQFDQQRKNLSLPEKIATVLELMAEANAFINSKDYNPYEVNENTRSPAVIKMLRLLDKELIVLFNELEKTAKQEKQSNKGKVYRLTLGVLLGLASGGLTLKGMAAFKTILWLKNLAMPLLAHKFVVEATAGSVGGASVLIRGFFKENKISKEQEKALLKLADKFLTRAETASENREDVVKGITDEIKDSEQSRDSVSRGRSTSVFAKS